MAREAGMLVVPHSANVSMVTVFTLHMMGAIPNPGLHIEFSIEPTSWVDGFLTEPLEARDGKVQIPAGPGWGVEVSPEEARRLDRGKKQIDPRAYEAYLRLLGADDTDGEGPGDVDPAGVARRPPGGPARGRLPGPSRRSRDPALTSERAETSPAPAGDSRSSTAGPRTGPSSAATRRWCRAPSGGGRSASHRRPCR